MTLFLQSRLRQENTHHDKHCLYSNVSPLDDIPQPQQHQCQYIICIHNSCLENTGKIFESQWGRFLLLIIWNGCLLCVLFKRQLSSPTPRREIQGADVHAVELEYSWQQTISHMYIKIHFLNLVNWNSQPWRFLFSWSSISCWKYSYVRNLPRGPMAPHISNWNLRFCDKIIWFHRQVKKPCQK